VPPASRPAPLTAAFILLAWVAVNYAWTLPFGFSDDDFVWIYGASQTTQSPRTLVLSPAFGGGFLRPAVQTSFALNYALAGLEPWSYRLVNLVAHAGSVLLLWFVLRALLDAELLALVAAAAFAAHPDGAATAVWVSGRTEVFCGFFYLAAIAAHLRRRTWLAAASFALALAAKESAVSLPLPLAAMAVIVPGELRRVSREFSSVAVRCGAGASSRPAGCP
jgi:hypothetical protein